MSKILAIQTDHKEMPYGRVHQSYSDHWKRLAAHHGFECRFVNVFDQDIIAQCSEANGFLWRPSPDPEHTAIAKRLIPTLEHTKGIPTYPTSSEVFLMQDKSAQKYAFEAAGVPTPDTTVYYHDKDAHDFCDRTDYPMVHKLPAGFGSNDVTLVNDPAHAHRIVNAIFHSQIQSGWELQGNAFAFKKRRLRQAFSILMPNKSAPPMQREAYFQSFQPGLDSIFRVITLGSKIIANRVMNRPGDFRSGGQSHASWDPSAIPEPVILTAHKASKTLNLQVAAYDIAVSDGKPLVLEVNFSFQAWPFAHAPGHWTAGKGDNLTWKAEVFSPEEEIFHLFTKKAGLLT